MASAPLADIEEIPRELLREPLEWFFAEHYRHRQLCRLVEEVAAASAFAAEPITRILDFIRYDLALHVIDEEEDLFPLLRRRALPEDEIENALGRLSAEHRADVAHAEAVRTRLEACLSACKAPGLDPQAKSTLVTFARHELRHLALENAVVLPIARLRLSTEDLLALSRRLAARRGLVLDARP
ncbi:MAG: hemerythrin domain-containing protein [Pseudomonadota bacterium]